MSLEVAVAVANKYEVSIGGERNHSGALSIDFADGLGVKDVVVLARGRVTLFAGETKGAAF